MKVLVLQLKRIGDLVLTTPLIRCLREAFPSAQIDLAIEGGSRGLLPCIDHDASIVFRRGRIDLPSWLKIFSSRFRSPYDICLDLTCNDRSASIAALSGAKRKIAYAKWKEKPFRKKIYTDFCDAKVAYLHAADYHTALLAPLGIRRSGVPSELRIPPGIAASTAQVLAREGVAGPYAVVHPCTVKAEKYWMPERWAEVADFLRGAGLTVVLTGSPAPGDLRHTREIAARAYARSAGKAPLRDLAGKLSLPELAATIDRASLVCGVDSAPLHFADALGKPALGLFGPTCPHQWCPRSAGSAVVTPLGTGVPGPEYYPGLPMERISAELVIHALGPLLPAASAGQPGGPEKPASAGNRRPSTANPEP